MKKSLFALVILAVLTGILVSSCPNPAADPVVNVRIRNEVDAIIDIQMRLGTVVFDFATTNLADGAVSGYQPIDAGVYRLEADSLGWEFVNSTDLSMSVSGNYTVTLAVGDITSVVKD